MLLVKARPEIEKLAPYVQGQSSIEGIENPIKLSSNESPLGPSPKAIEAYSHKATNLFRYPDGSQSELREAIADVYGLDPTRIICGNGSEELMQIMIRTFLGAGDEAIISEYCFGICKLHAFAQGAVVRTAKEPDCMMNVDNILAEVTEKTKLVAISTPNNPPGTYMSKSELHRLHAALPKHVLLLVDGAYAEYVTASDYDCGLGLAKDASNVIVTRTFSKLYGLAGLRIGWSYGPAYIIELMQRLRTPFNANAAAMAAAAAAIADREYADKIREYNNSWRNKMMTALSSLGLHVYPSVTNFILMQFPEGHHSPEGAWKHLIAGGIIPRPVNSGGPERCLRVSVGLAEENEAFIRSISSYMRA